MVKGCREGGRRGMFIFLYFSVCVFRLRDVVESVGVYWSV